MIAQVEEMSSQAQQLAETADQLKVLAARFKLEDDTATAGSSRSNSTRKPTPMRRVA